MADTAAHLVDRVFPEVPVRQWVLSLPHPLRFLLGYDRTLCGEVLGVLMRVVLGWQERRARDLFGVEGARGGAVTVVQRFSSALALNLHFHSLVLDGVHVPGAGPGREPRFQELPAPTDEEVLQVLATVVQRVTRLLVRRGRLTESDGRQLFEAVEEVELDPLLATCQAASVRGRIGLGPRAGQRVPRLGDRVEVDELVRSPKRRCADVAGYSLHADVAVPAHDRARLERLCRYVTRPPLATQRLSECPDGHLAYMLRKPWRDGTQGFKFSPEELLEKLVALVPPPRGNSVRYHGVLGANARGRAALVGGPRGSREVSSKTSPRHGAGRSEVPDGRAEDRSRPEVPHRNASEAQPLRPRRLTWAELMARVFRNDVLECQRCHGRLRIIAAIVQAEVIVEVLGCLGLPADPPLAAPARAPPQAELEFQNPDWSS
jgi:hypothetical protein